MTALAPTQMWASTTTATVTSASTLGALGYAAGDLLIVDQAGVAAGSSAPVAPTINGSNSGFTSGPDTSGSDIYVNAGTNFGRLQRWSKILTSGDLAFTVTIDKTGYGSNIHRFSLSKLSHANGFDSSRVAQRVSSTDAAYGPRTATCSWSGGTASLLCTGTVTPNISVGDIITVTGATRAGYNVTATITAITTTTTTNDTIQYAIPDPGGSATGATISKNFKLTDVARPACVWITSTGPSTISAGTFTYDGATSGTKFQRDPYYHNGTETDTDGAHGHHYGVGSASNIFQVDYQEYDTTDTISSVLQNNNLNNATHATGIVVYQTAPVPNTLSGKMNAAGSMKGNLAGGQSTLSGKMNSAASMKAPLGFRPNDQLMSGKAPAAAMMGAPSGMDAASGPGFSPIDGKMSVAAKMKGDLQTFPTNFITGKLKAAGYLSGRLDFGTIKPITGSPFYLEWDKVGQRFYEIGLDRGVIYFQDQSVVVWNGLTEIVEKFGASTSPIYYDGRKIGEDVSLGDFSATLKAITYPDEFTMVDGSSEIRHGILVGSQPPQPFDLSWRTLVYDDSGSPIGYKIHILYNVIAVPSDKTDATLSDTSTLTEFEWELSATPQEIPGFAPTAHFVIDSTKIDTFLLQNIESLLYGNAGTPPNLPQLSDFADFIANWFRIEVIDHGDGTFTVHSDIPGTIVDHGDGSFSIFGINGTVIDADSYTISST